MALLDFDSFDYYQTANLGEVYDGVDNGGDFGPTGSAQIVTGFGRCNTNCLKVSPTPALSGVIRGVAAADDTCILGFAVNNTPTGSLAPVLFDIMYAGGPVLRVQRGLDASLIGHYAPSAAFPPVSFVSFGGLLQGNAWHYLGMKVLLAGGGAGSVTIEIDGVVRQVITGITTSSVGSVWTGIHLGGRQFSSGTICYYDDMYICDGTGAAPWNDLLGDVHVQRLRPTAPGDLTQFTVTGAAANWVAEDDGDQPNKATYVSSDVAGTTDSYEFEDIALVTGQVIYGAKESALCYKDTAGSRTLEFLTRNGGVTHLEGTPLGIPAGINNWAYIKRIMETDPTTGVQFTPAGVNSNQYGMDLVT